MSLWFIDENGYQGNAWVGGIPDLDWQVRGIGDYTGDGKADVLWRHNVSGNLVIWKVNQNGYAGAISLGTVDAAWQTLNHVNFKGNE